MPRNWILVDVENCSLGRAASQVAHILMGKNKPTYKDNIISGDNVIIVNADKIKISNKKGENKNIIHHTGYPGGQRIISLKKMFEKNPCLVFYNAVKGMLPKNINGRKMLKNLRVFKDKEHNMQSVKPVKVELKYRA